MRKSIIIIALSLITFPAFAADNSFKGNLYYWGGVSDQTTRYERHTYRNMAKISPENVCMLVAVFEDMVKHPGGLRNVPPPGLCAEYGYLLCKPEVAQYFEQSATKEQRKLFERSDYTAYFPSYGRELILLETKYYPNSEKFLSKLLEKLTDR